MGFFLDALFILQVGTKRKSMLTNDIIISYWNFWSYVFTFPQAEAERQSWSLVLPTNFNPAQFHSVVLIS